MIAVRRICVPWLVLLSAVLICACGGSSHSSGGNGVASKPVKAILASAFAAVAHSTSMQMSGVVPGGKQEGTTDVDMGRGVRASDLVFEGECLVSSKLGVCSMRPRSVNGFGRCLES
jgi:hypothetical protein